MTPEPKFRARWRELTMLVATVLLAFASGFSYGRAYQAELMMNACKPEILRRWFDMWKVPGE